MRSSIPVELPGFHPVQMVVDLDVSGNPCGAMAMFGPGLDIRTLADAVDAGYARWRKPDLPYTWRIEDQRFVLALSPEGDWIRLFYLPFIDAKHPPASISGPCTCEAPPKSK